MVRKYQMTHNQVIPKAHLHGVSSCALHQYDINGSATNKLHYHYFLTFADDLSSYRYIYSMKHKSETFEKFKEFQSEVENHHNKKIKFLRSDHGGEYLGYEFGLHIKQCGIVLQLTPHGTPQGNGVSERHNRTLLDGAIYDVSYRFTTIVLGLCIRDSCIHFK